MSGPSAKKLTESRPPRARMMNRLQRAWGESPFYQAQLKGPAPDRFYFMPVDPRTPDEAAAKMLAAGKLTIGSQSIDCEGELPDIWDKASAPGALHAFLQDFSWLRHMTALGDGGKAPARAIMKGWLDRYEKWSPEAWAPYHTAERLTQLCCHGGLILRGGDALWRSRVLTSMARQTRHLVKASHRANTGYERLMTAMGLTIASLCLPGCDAPAERGLEMLRRELRLQMRPDGGHVSRNPSHQLSIIIRLQMVLKALDARRLSAPGFLRHVSARATAFLQLFRSGDGGLAVFNGGYEDDGRALVTALSDGDRDDTPIGFARHSGFQRLDAGRLTLIADTGAAMRAGASSDAQPDHRFKGGGSFHFSSGRARIVLNCGSGAHLSGDWVKALRKPDAHSCLTSDLKTEESVILTGGSVTHRRGEDARGQLLEIERSVDAEALRYIRRFFVAARGDDLRGQERLSGLSEAFAQSLVVRFHLHPAVRASRARDGKSVILAAPNHEGWRFRTNCKHLDIEKSIYCGEGGAPKATEQIVLRADGLEPARDGDMVIKWGFRRVDAG